MPSARGSPKVVGCDPRVGVEAAGQGDERRDDPQPRRRRGSGDFTPDCQSDHHSTDRIQVPIVADTELRLTVRAVFESLRDIDPKAAETVWLRTVEGMTIDEVSRSQQRKFWDVRADYDFGLKWMADQLKG